MFYIIQDNVTKRYLVRPDGIWKGRAYEKYRSYSKPKLKGLYGTLATVQKDYNGYMTEDNTRSFTILKLDIV